MLLGVTKLMRIKPGVKITGLRPEMLIALQCADRIWDKLGQELVITSGIEGKHAANSDHYKGLAVDLRTRYFTLPEQQVAYDSLKESLGEDFAVIIESTHMHVAYRPRYLVD